MKMTAKIGAGLISMAVAAALWISLAAPAHADSSDYLSRVQEEIPMIYSKYGSAALLAEGYKVCDWNASGVSSHSRITRIQADLPMSDSAAIWIDTLAPSRLGC